MTPPAASPIPQVVTSCPKFLAVLGHFYDGAGVRDRLEATLIPAGEIPPLYRPLLEHTNDMTSTLTKFHGEPLLLEVMQREIVRDVLTRHIVLRGSATRRLVEYGAARIDLATLDQPVRRDVLAGRRPLGGILNGHAVQYNSCPGGFFRVQSGTLINRVFGLPGPTQLYGRCNCLVADDGRTIAEVVEILPPS